MGQLGVAPTAPIEIARAMVRRVLPLHREEIRINIACPSWIANGTLAQISEPSHLNGQLSFSFQPIRSCRTFRAATLLPQRIGNLLNIFCARRWRGLPRRRAVFGG